jgi:uncharacterized protein YqhQ
MTLSFQSIVTSRFVFNSFLEAVFRLLIVVIYFFWVLCKKIKNIFGRKIKNNSSEKRMPKRLENGQKLIEEVQKYKD